MMGGALKNTGLFSNRNFRAYFAARVASQLGDQIYIFAVGWYVMDVTRSSFHMAALLAVNSLMVMAVAPFGGLVSDRVSRKTVMVATDLIQGSLFLALVFLQHGRLSIGVLYAVTVVWGLCGALFSPASNAIIPGIVGRELLPATIAVGQATENLCLIGGIIAGGALYKLLGIYGILILNASTNLLAAAMESRIKVAPLPRARTNDASSRAAIGRFAAEMRDGLRQVRSDRMVASFLLINVVFSIGVLPIPTVYLPYFFNVILRAAPTQAALAQAGIWAGLLVGVSVAARVVGKRKPGSVMAGGLFAISANTFMFALILWASPLLSVKAVTAACVLSNVLAGASAAFYNVPLYAIYHARCREEFRGRFWGLENSLRTASTCGGLFLAGILAQRLPMGALFATASVLMLLMALWAQGLRSSAVPAPQA